MVTKADCQEVQVKNVPKGLLKDFDELVVPEFPGGRSEALRALMRQAVREKRITNAN